MTSMSKMNKRQQNIQLDDEGEGVALLRADSPGSEVTDNNMAKEKPVDFDTALGRAGFGKFHYWLLFVCGWANASDAIEILCISFLLPSAQCDLQLTSEEKGWLSAILFIGMLVGGYLWGSLSDVYGRKRTLILAMLINAFCGFGSSLSQEKTSFFIIRFLSGVGVGGSIPVVWTYFGEFQPPNKRGMMLSALATFWMVGNVFVAILAWMIIPRTHLGVTEGPFLFNSWRIFTLICGLPAFFVAIMLFTLPESPKFLLKNDKPSESLKIIAQIFAQNTGRSKSLFPVDQLEEMQQDEEDEEVTNDVTVTSQYDDSDLEKPVAKSIRSSSALVRVVRNTMALFSRKLWRVTTLMLYINFAISFGYYGLWLWFPTLFDKLNKYYNDHPNATVSVCQITSYRPETTDDDGAGTNPFCGPAPTTEVFTNSIYISLAAAPANLWTVIHMDKLGRKFFLILSMTLSGFSAFLVYLVKSELANLMVSIAFGLVSTSGFNALDCLSIELFPTKLRATGMAVTLIATRFGAIMGNVMFGYLVEVNCAVPLAAVASLLLSGGLLGFFLPNTTRQVLV